MKKKLIGILGIVSVFALVLTACPTGVDSVDTVDATVPVIVIQPESDSYYVDDTITALFVEVTNADNGILSYQWYSNTADLNYDGDVIDGADQISFVPPNSPEGVMYYYVVVTNTNWSATGRETASVTSDTARITLTDRLNAQIPNFTQQPQGEAWFVGDAITPLTALAVVNDGGTITYQWYSNSANSNTGGTLIPDADESSFTPPNSPAGTVYYYVVATNTNNYASGRKESEMASDVAAIVLTDRVDAAVPEITAHPVSANYFVPEEGFPTTIVPLSVTAGKSDDGVLSYAWYSNSANSNEGGTLIAGQTAGTYTPPDSPAGTVYYYVVVTNTKEDATGNKASTAVSNTAAIVLSARVHAAVPVITEQPVGDSYFTENDPIAPLTVTATVSDAGVLSYQWYKNDNASATGGTEVGTDSNTYTPDVSDEGLYHYYVVITNTFAAATGRPTATATSQVADISLSDRSNAQTPAITTQPVGNSYTFNAAYSGVTGLSVAALIHDEGILSYQWYSNSSESNEGGSAVGTNSVSYQPVINEPGTYYFYVAVTNTNDQVTGQKTATAVSSVAVISVTRPAAAEAPAITTQPASASYNWNAAFTNITALSVAVTPVTDDGVLSYQWYRNTAASTDGATTVGTNSATLNISKPETPVTYFYYVAVTNTNIWATQQTTVTASNFAQITINQAANPVTPVITAHPASASYTMGDTVSALNVVVTPVTDDGVLSYQWYSTNSANIPNPPESGTPVGTDSASYTPTDAAVGSYYYYVVATNTNTYAAATTATTVSSLATITIVARPAATPVITTQPVGKVYHFPAGAIDTLTVAASINDNGTLSYQWYSTASTIIPNPPTSGTPVGTNSASYTPTISAQGFYRYYVIVTNTNLDTDPQIATTVSNLATITIRNPPVAGTGYGLPSPEFVAKYPYWVYPTTSVTPTTTITRAEQLPPATYWENMNMGEVVAGHNHRYPDPFHFANGNRVASIADWENRRLEMHLILTTYWKGDAPPLSKELVSMVLSGTNNNNWTLTHRASGRTLTGNFGITATPVAGREGRYGLTNAVAHGTGQVLAGNLPSVTASSIATFYGFTQGTGTNSRISTDSLGGWNAALMLTAIQGVDDQPSGEMQYLMPVPEGTHPYNESGNGSWFTIYGPFSSQGMSQTGKTAMYRGVLNAAARHGKARFGWINNGDSGSAGIAMDKFVNPTGFRLDVSLQEALTISGFSPTEIAQITAGLPDNSEGLGPRTGHAATLYGTERTPGFYNVNPDGTLKRGQHRTTHVLESTTGPMVYGWQIDASPVGSRGLSRRENTGSLGQFNDLWGVPTYPGPIRAGMPMWGPDAPVYGTPANSNQVAGRMRYNRGWAPYFEEFFAVYTATATGTGEMGTTARRATEYFPYVAWQCEQTNSSGIENWFQIRNFSQSGHNGAGFWAFNDIHDQLNLDWDGSTTRGRRGYACQVPAENYFATMTLAPYGGHMNAAPNMQIRVNQPSQIAHWIIVDEIYKMYGEMEWYEEHGILMEDPKYPGSGLYMGWDKYIWNNLTDHWWGTHAGMQGVALASLNAYRTRHLDSGTGVGTTTELALSDVRIARFREMNYNIDDPAYYFEYRKMDFSRPLPDGSGFNMPISQRVRNWYGPNFEVLNDYYKGEIYRTVSRVIPAAQANEATQEFFWAEAKAAMEAGELTFSGVKYKNWDWRGLINNPTPMP